jgi:hypothetical protein
MLAFCHLLAIGRPITIVRPETVVRWHRMGFATYWRWKSRSRGGRPRITQEIRDLIGRMSLENRLWGATKIHGELLKLGIEIAQSTVSKYIVKRRGPPSQSWRTFLRNHANAIAAIDLCVVPTINFECLFAFLAIGHGRRRLLWFAVTGASDGGVAGAANRRGVFPGIRHRAICSATMMVPTDKPSPTE